MIIRPVLLISAAILAAVLSPSCVSAIDPFNELAEKTNKKLVKVFGAGGFSRLNNFGTGIIISKDGYVLTVASQLLDTSELVVHLYDGQRLRALQLRLPHLRWPAAPRPGRGRRAGTRRGDYQDPRRREEARRTAGL